jgi:hypothetical protein
MTDLPAAKVAARATIIAAVLTLIGVIITVLVKNSDDGGGSDPARVAAVSLTAPVRSFRLKCPFTFSFDGKIDVEGGTGNVVYRWLHSDGFGGPTSLGDRKQVAVGGPGSVTVTDEWTPNVPFGDVARTATLEVLEPRNLRSEPVLISGTCDPRWENPPSPPPQVPGGPPG